MELNKSKQELIWNLLRNNNSKPNSKEILKKISEPISKAKIAEVELYSKIIRMILSFYRDLTYDQIAENAGTSICLVKKITRYLNLTWRFRKKPVNGIVTRKFALILSDKSALDDIRKQLIKFRDLENLYIEFLINEIKTNPLIIRNKSYKRPNFRLVVSQKEKTDFKKINPNERLLLSAKKRIRRYIYDYYSDPNDPSRNLSKLKSNYEKSTNLIERAKQNAIQYPFYAVRNWIIRNERLKKIISNLNLLLSSDKSREVWDYSKSKKITVIDKYYILEAFLSGKKMFQEFLSDFNFKHRKNVLGDYDNPSNEYLINHIGQIRNILFSRKRMDSILKKEIERLIRFIELNKNSSNELLDDFFSKIFKKFVNNRSRQDLNPQDYFLKLFIQKIKTDTTRLAKKKLKYKKIYGNSYLVSFVNKLFKDYSILEINDFKRIRDRKVDRIQINVSRHYSSLLQKSLKSKILEQLVDYLKKLLQNLNLNLSKHVFKRSFSKISVKSFNFNGFKEYMIAKFVNNAKAELKSLLLQIGSIDTIVSNIKRELKEISSEIFNITSIPKIKSLSIPLVMTEYIYEFNKDSLSINFGLIKKRGKERVLKLNTNQQKRFREFLEKGYKLRNPTISLKGRKLILCQSFEKKMDKLYKPQSVQNKNIEVSEDLGIKHFAVLSVRDKSKPSNNDEIKGYFINQRTLFDMKFDDNTGKFVYLQNKKLNPTNVKQRLINLRKEHRIVQKLRMKYENRHPDDYRKKIKWYHRMKTESYIWNKIQRLNKEIVNRLSGLIVRIAQYHGANRIKAEELSWSKHSKKSEKGSWIAFWQTHWFFSQVQYMTLQNALRKKIEFVVVDAYKSSRICAVCREEGFRNGKTFHCKRCGTYVDSDLNASRLIGKRKILRNLSIS